MEAVFSSESSVNICRTKQCHFPESSALHIRSFQNLQWKCSRCYTLKLEFGGAVIILQRTPAQLPGYMMAKPRQSTDLWLQIQRPGFDSRRYQIFWEVVGLERGPLSLMSSIEELFERKIRGVSLEIREYGRTDPSRWQRDTLYSQKSWH
jgi:hypothetical protein